MTTPIFTDEEAKRCRAICKQYAKSFYLAARFFPKEVQKSVFALYAFVRIPDELVDNPLPNTDPLKELDAFEDDWKRTLQVNYSEDVVKNAFLKVVTNYAIPSEYIESFFKAMRQDTHQETYASYEALVDYMHGSATVVGYSMAHIMGATDKASLAAARDLAEAFQLTNFLRDIQEDYQGRHRLYLPLDELQKFSVNLEDIYSQKFSPEMGQFMRFQIERNRKLYRMAEKGIATLPISFQRPVTLAALYYEKVLDKLELRGGNPFGTKMTTTSGEKIALLIRYITNTL